MRIQRLTENISYTPEKEAEFLKQGKEELKKARETYKKFVGDVMFLQIQELVDRPEATESLRSKIEQAENNLEKVHDKYYNIVDLYEYESRNKTIEELDRVVDDIDHIRHSMWKLGSALENLSKAVKEIEELDPDR